MCGHLSRKEVGQTVTLSGWVHKRRDIGKVIFIILRDKSGLVQLLFDPEIAPGAHTAASQLRSEFVITVTGVNGYTYTMDGTPAASPATGTIIATGAHLEGLTDASGNISDSRTLTLDQPLQGFARKSTASPRFKSFPLAGTCDNVDGVTINVQLILDE